MLPYIRRPDGVGSIIHGSRSKSVTMPAGEPRDGPVVVVNKKFQMARARQTCPEPHHGETFPRQVSQHIPGTHKNASMRGVTKDSHILWRILNPEARKPFVRSLCRLVDARTTCPVSFDSLVEMKRRIASMGFAAIAGPEGVASMAASG